jgi:lactate racemase
MKIRLDYNNSETGVNVSAGNVLDILSPRRIKSGNETRVLRNALSIPPHNPLLEKFLLGAKEILVVLNDATKPSPTARVLEFLGRHITDRFKFLVASGTHRAPTSGELKLIFGKLYPKLAGRIFIHNSAKGKEMVYIGTTPRKTEVYINRLAMLADKILVIGSVEPHYFAGYTGGRKAIIPGIASYKTIEANHSFALDPDAASLKLKGNPVNEDIMDGLKFFDKEIFSIQVVLNHNRKIYAAEAGDIVESHLSILKKANDVFAVRAKKKADIVVTVAKSPWDINFYQSQQAIENGKRILKNGGILILVSKCRKGFGEGHYFDILSSCKTPAEVISKINAEPYKLGAHKAKRIAELELKSSFWAVTGLPDNKIKKMFAKPYHSIQKAVDDALALKGKKAKISFLLDGATTVPVVNTVCSLPCVVRGAKISSKAKAQRAKLKYLI